MKDVQAMLKDVFAETLQEMLEVDDQLGCSKHDVKNKSRKGKLVRRLSAQNKRSLTWRTDFSLPPMS